LMEPPPDPAPPITRGRKLPLYRDNFLKDAKGTKRLLRFLRSHDGQQVRLEVTLNPTESFDLDVEDAYFLLTDPCPNGQKTPGVKCVRTQLRLDKQTSDSGLFPAGGGVLGLSGYFAIRDLPGSQMGVRTIRLTPLRYAG
jgi:hypothetical protein